MYGLTITFGRYPLGAGVKGPLAGGSALVFVIYVVIKLMQQNIIRISSFNILSDVIIEMYLQATY